MTIFDILLTWSLLLFIEIVRQFYIINVMKRRPVYWASQLLRIAVAVAFFFASGYLGKDNGLDYYQWLGMVPMLPLTFWFFFDYGYVQFQNFAVDVHGFEGVHKQFDYLNPKGSWLDQFQYNHGGTFTWFFFKAILAGAGLYLFIAGIDQTWNPSW